MPNAQEVRDLLEYASQLPWAPSRSAQIAQAAMWADALEGETDLKIDAYLELTMSYQQGNEEWKALAPLSTLLNMFEKNPADFDADQIEELAWLYKGTVSAAGRNPAVSREQLEELTTGLAQFVSEQGFSMHVVHGVRVMLALRKGDLDEAREALTLWRATPRDEICDCAGCDPEKQIAEATARKDWERAVATAMPLFDEEGACAAQPYSIRAHAMIPLLMSGRPDTAWEAHVRSYHQHRGSANAMDILGTHMEFLVRSGRWQRALDILRDSIALTSQAESASLLMDYLRGAALTAREAAKRGKGEDPLGALCTGHSQWCEGPRLDANTPLSEVADRLSGWALDVAALFDRRNGNDYCTVLTREIIEAGPVDEEAEKRANSEWRFELVGERESMPEPISTVEGQDARPIPPSRSSRGKSETIDETDPYPAVDYDVPKPPASMREAFERYMAIGDAIGFSVENNVLTDWALASSENIADLDFDTSNPEEALLFANFAKTLMTLGKQYSAFEGIYARVAPVIASMSDDAPVAIPGFFAKVFGRAGTIMSRKELFSSQLELLKYSCEFSRLSWQGEEVSADFRASVREFLDRFTSQIAQMVPTINRGKISAFDLSTIEDSLSTCGENYLECGDIEKAMHSLDIFESLKPACVRSGTKPEAFKRTILLERAELALEAQDFRRAAQSADQVLRSTTQDPYTAFFARLIICVASLKAGESAEAASQATRMNEIISRTPLRSLGLASTKFITDAFVAVRRREEAIEILEQAILSCTGSWFGKTMTALLRTALAEYYLNIDNDQEAFDTATAAIPGLIECGCFPTASRAGEIANKAAEELGDRSLRLTAITNALKVAERMNDHSSVIALRRMQANLYLNVPSGTPSDDDKDQALLAAEAGISWLDSHSETIDSEELIFLRAGIEYIRGWVYMKRNEPEIAIPILRQSHEMQKEIKDSQNYPFPLAALADCYTQLGDTDALRDLVTELNETAKKAHSSGSKLRALARDIEKQLSDQGEA